MVFSESLYTKSDSKKEVVNENESLFIYSLNLLRESDNNVNEMMKNIHIGAILSESKDDYYLREFSVSETIHSIINWFIKIIKQLWGRFKNIFLKITYNDNTIKEYEDRLRNMEGTFSIDFDRYNYTCFDADIPSINLKTQFNDEYNTLIEKLESIRNLKSKDERIYRMQVIKSEVVEQSSNPAYYDRARQNALHVSYMVSSSNYAEELFNRFRDSGKYIGNKIDRFVLNSILDRYFDCKKIKNELEQSKNDTIKSAEDVEKRMSSLSLQKLNSVYVPYDMDEELLFKGIITAKTEEVSNICNIFVMAFSAKLDAVKEAIMQDRKILIEAIKLINIGGAD